MIVVSCLQTGTCSATQLCLQEGYLIYGQCHNDTWEVNRSDHVISSVLCCRM
jgi:hypothetical protein